MANLEPSGPQKPRGLCSSSATDVRLILGIGFYSTISDICRKPSIQRQNDNTVVAGSKISLKEKILGEITFIIEPIMSKITKLPEEEIIKFGNSLLNKGMNISEVSRLMSKDLSISKRDIYQLLIKNRIKFFKHYSKTRKCDL